MDVKLPEWPGRIADVVGPLPWEHMADKEELIYQRARAEAAIARLKVAMRALKAIGNVDIDAEHLALTDYQIAREALAQIGLPEKG